MTTVLTLLIFQSFLGGFDTLYYHELRNALPARADLVRPELYLHAVRDFIYSIFLFTLPFVAWTGALTIVLALLLLAEIVITLVDFAVEDRVRIPLGGVPKLERSLHTILAILYGAYLTTLVPHMLQWWGQGTGFVAHVGIPAWMQWLCVFLGAGSALSGVRDLGAALGVRALQFSLGSRSAAGS